MIQANPSYRSDDSLDVSALPWRPRSAENFFDTQHLDLFPKLVSVDPISIPLDKESLARNESCVVCRSGRPSLSKGEGSVVYSKLELIREREVKHVRSSGWPVSSCHRACKCPRFELPIRPFHRHRYGVVQLAEIARPGQFVFR